MKNTKTNFGLLWTRGSHVGSGREEDMSECQQLEQDRAPSICCFEKHVNSIIITFMIENTRSSIKSC